VQGGTQGGKGKDPFLKEIAGGTKKKDETTAVRHFTEPLSREGPGDDLKNFIGRLRSCFKTLKEEAGMATKGRGWEGPS